MKIFLEFQVFNKTPQMILNEGLAQDLTMLL